MGSLVNYRLLNDLLYIIYVVDWAKVPLCHARRGTLLYDASLERTARGGEFASHHPYL